MQSSRRQFLVCSTATVVGAALLTKTAEARADEAPAADGYRVVAEYQDTRTDWSGVNEDTLLVRAEDFIIGSVSGLIADEGSHHHTFDVSVDDMNKLKNGETVQIRTSMTLNHTHVIVIDPVNYKIPGGRIIDVKDVAK